MSQSFDMSSTDNDLQSKSKWKKRIPVIIFGVIFLGVLSGLIATAVLYSEEHSENEKLRKQAETDSTSPIAPTSQSNATTTISTVSTVTVSGETDSSTPSTTSPPLPYREIWRLNQNISVDKYIINLQVHLPYDKSEDNDTRAFTTKGDVEIFVKPMVPGVKEFQFHARTATNLSSGYLKFDSNDVTLLFLNNTPVEHTEVAFQPQQDIVIIKTKDTLHEDDKSESNYKIRIHFTGTISKENDNQGLYRSSYEINNVTRYVAATQFQPYKARRVFPCFDEPAFRSRFEISVVHDARFKVYSNGKALSDSTYQQPSDANGTTWARTNFTSTPKMSSYLVAVLVVNDDFAIETKDIVYNTTESRKFGLITRKSLQNSGKFALDQGDEMVRYLSGERFGQPLYDHLDKIDMATVPDFNSGAMENWGLVLYKEARLLYDPNVNSAEDKMGVAMIVGHELSHFLFGNLITCEFWDNAWLNEGFARFFQYELVHATKPHWKVKNLFPYMVTRSAFKLDSYETTHALYNETVQSFEQVDTMFDTITYAKGASILQMIRGVMGEEQFDQSIKNYTKIHKLGNVRYKDLLNQLMHKDNLSEHLTPWIVQKGYPVLQLIRTGDKISFTQKQFLFQTANAAQNAEQTWHIPLTIKTASSNANSVCWLKEKTGDLGSACTGLTMPNNSEVFVANSNQNGYYRVDYDTDTWGKLSKEFTDGSFIALDGTSRGQILDDAFNLARVGGTFKANYDIALGLTLGKYLTTESEYTAVASWWDNLKFIDQMLWEDLNAYKTMTTYVGACVTKKYKSNMWDHQFVDDNSAVDKTLNSAMFNSLIIDVACYYTTACVTTAVNQFSENFPDETDLFTEATKRNVLSAMLCYAVRDKDNGLTNWAKLEKRLNPELSTSQKLIILRGLACTADITSLRKLLAKTWDKSLVRTQDIASVLSYMTKFSLGTDLVWDFVRINWDDLPSKGSIVTNLASKFSTEEKLAELKRFHRSKDSSGSYPDKIAVLKAITEVESNLQWIKKHKTQVVEFFSKHPQCT